MHHEDIENEEIIIENCGSATECTIQDVDCCLEDAGYGVAIIPKGKAFICFSSNDGEALGKIALKVLSELNEQGVLHDCYVKR